MDEAGKRQKSGTARKEGDKMRRKLWKEDKQKEAVKRRTLNVFSRRVLTRFESKVLTAC